MRLSFLYILVFVFTVLANEAYANQKEAEHAFAMHGKPKYGENFKHFEYVNPLAPKGGKLINEAMGTFDSFNPFILKGVKAAGLGLIYDSLMVGSSDEAFTNYGLIAESIIVPEDRSWVSFNLNPDAEWHDGRPISVDDVIWTFNTLISEGHPSFKIYYRDVELVEQTGKRQVTFRFPKSTNRELPLILGQMTILPKHYWEGQNFKKTTLKPPLGSGAYRIKNFEAGRSISYERVKNYWATDLPVNKGQSNFDEISYEYYRDRDVATEAFKSGAFDLRAENQSKRWATAYDFPALKEGKVKKILIPHERPTGMQGFVFNIRKDFFSDPKVRLAINYAWDFEWTNKTLMYNAYKRTNSYFSNSELSSSGTLPEGEELKILQKFKRQVPKQVFDEVYKAPQTDGSGNNRKNLRLALKLLREAGWAVKDGKLVNRNGIPLKFELLIAYPSIERLALPLKQSLKRLGIEMSIRTVDVAQYQQRVDTFDFDMIVSSFGQSLSPGNEQRDFWHSTNADRPGSRNLIGIKEPAIDKLVELVIESPDRESLISRTRALDRVLLWNHYVIPHFHLQASRLVFWNIFGRPKNVAKYSSGFPNTWWLDIAKEKEVRAWKNQRTN
ncbi:MAG: extracellular solute-binding protein [Pseudomonadota bacterium]|nr:extracellular solute-binding protein [Pseudomonadota bacterium]